MHLGSGNSGQVQVDPATTTGSTVTITLRDNAGVPLDALRADLRASLDAEDLGSLAIKVTQAESGTWSGDFMFPLTGTCTLTLTVEDTQPAAVVTHRRTQHRVVTQTQSAATGNAPIAAWSDVADVPRRQRHDELARRSSK